MKLPGKHINGQDSGHKNNTLLKLKFKINTRVIEYIHSSLPSVQNKEPLEIIKLVIQEEPGLFGLLQTQYH